MPKHPWQVSWLPARQDIWLAAGVILPGRFHWASGFVHTRTGNSGATAADLHRFPFSPGSKLWLLLVAEHLGRFIQLSWKAMWRAGSSQTRIAGNYVTIFMRGHVNLYSVHESP